MAGVVHITEEEAAKDYVGLFERVRAGDRVVVESPGKRGVVLAPDASALVLLSPKPKGRTIAQILERLDAWESVHGVLVMDESFADDVQAAHERLNQPMDSSKWD